MRKREIHCYGLLLVLTLVTSCISQDIDSIKRLCEASDADCKTCITAHQSCSWCGEPDKGPHSLTNPIKRCKLHSDNLLTCLNATNHPSELITNPTSHVVFVRNENFTDAGPDFFDNDTNIGKTVIQLRPQVLTVKLRKDQPVKVNVTFKKVIDYPLDIYYVMDLSYSMKDDLQTLKTLGTGLFENVRKNVTKNVQFGFGSFVDKVIMPFTSTVPSLLENPCINQKNKTDCARPFGFRHQVSITGDASAFADAIWKTNISGNIDIPEGSFDALMQIAVCNQIKWRSGATHVILLTTDATPHVAMDGKLAAILEANDMKCHLVQSTTSEDYIYFKSKTLDYPSLGQLKEVFKRNKIHSIYAVTKDVLDLYQGIEHVLSDAYVAQLEADSGNINSLINQTYSELKERLAIAATATPANVRQTHRVYCPGRGPVEGSLECNHIQNDDTIVFEFEFTSNQCPSDPNHRDSIVLSSSSLQDEVTINLEYICECDCQSSAVANSSHCNNHGSLKCGLCSCDEGRAGSLCQCSALNNGKDVRETCKRPGSELFCENRGVCECGECTECESPYNGTYCECMTTGCPSNIDGLCGGEKKGWCNNCGDDKDKCVCHGEFSIKPTDKTCSCHPSECGADETSNVTCSGRGICQCDTCVCNHPSVWTGRYCDTCIDPSCTGVTMSCDEEQIRKCAQCKTKSDDCDEYCAHNSFLVYSKVPEIPKDCDQCAAGDTSWNCKQCEKHSKREHVPCEKFHSDGCSYYYTIVWTKSSQILVYVKEYTKDDCPKPINPLTIVLPVVGGIVFFGVLGLILWKIYTHLRDKRQYEEFLEEEKKRKWTKGENPIFEKPDQKFSNPMFDGNAIHENE